MDLSRWIDDVGGMDVAAALLGEKYRTVRSWYYLDRAPTAKAAGRIVKVAAGKVDYNGIYAPYVAAMSAREVAA